MAALAATTEGPAQRHCRETRWPHSSWTQDIDDSSTRRLRVEVDADGDGQDDVLEAAIGFGSGTGETQVIVTLAAGERVELLHTFGFARIVGEQPLPQTPPGAERERMLEAFEDALFAQVCSAPDPSLQWLLDESRRLRWVEGPPALPDTYAMRSPDGRSWVTYLGHNHAHRTGRPEPVVLAEDGARVLLGTAHGVILTDAERTRHAWIWVSRGEHKLRWPSVLAARIEGSKAVVTLTRGDGYLVELAHGGDVATRDVTIDLETGALR